MTDSDNPASLYDEYPVIRIRTLDDEPHTGLMQSAEIVYLDKTQTPPRVERDRFTVTGAVDVSKILGPKRYDGTTDDPRDPDRNEAMLTIFPPRQARSLGHKGTLLVIYHQDQ